MSQTPALPDGAAAGTSLPQSEVIGVPPASRPRMPRGERRQQILQALARMLERADGARITTAALAAELGVSEAALYRHFASKAKMFEALIDFIESSIFGLLAQLREREPAGPQQAGRMVALVLQFGARNPGLVRVMAGDALVNEHQRLRERMSLLFDKLEAALRQSLRDGANTDADTLTPDADAKVTASILLAFTMGRLQRFARSGLRRSPLDQLDDCLARML